jgi:hypothetical protein
MNNPIRKQIMQYLGLGIVFALNGESLYAHYVHEQITEYNRLKTRVEHIKAKRDQQISEANGHPNRLNAIEDLYRPNGPITAYFRGSELSLEQAEEKVESLSKRIDKSRPYSLFHRLGDAVHQLFTTACHKE